MGNKSGLTSGQQKTLDAYRDIGTVATQVDSIYSTLGRNIPPVAPYLQALSLQESNSGLDKGLSGSHSYNITQIDPIRMLDFQKDYNEMILNPQTGQYHHSSYYHRGQQINGVMQKLGYKDWDISKLAKVKQNNKGNLVYDKNSFKYKDDPRTGLILTRMLMLKDSTAVGKTPADWDTQWKNTWNTGVNAGGKHGDMVKNINEINRLVNLETVNTVINNSKKLP